MMKGFKKICIPMLVGMFCVGTTVFASWTSSTTITVPASMGPVSTSSEAKTDNSDTWSFRPVVMNTGINTSLYDVTQNGACASQRLSVGDGDDDLQYALHCYYYADNPPLDKYKQIMNSQSSNWFSHSVSFYWSPDWKTYNGQ